jgi:hypothetical protein
VTRVGVVVFPGSNCEYDALSAVTSLGADAELVWHSTTDLEGFDAIILPGGFAHGDYLRPGALARFSPVMEAVGRFATEGGSVLSDRSGPVARRAAEEPWSHVSVPAHHAGRHLASVGFDVPGDAER